MGKLTWIPSCIWIIIVILFTEVAPEDETYSFLTKILSTYDYHSLFGLFKWSELARFSFKILAYLHQPYELKMD